MVGWRHQKDNSLFKEVMTMGDWMDFNGDGEVDSTERFFAMCQPRGT